MADHLTLGDGRRVRVRQPGPPRVKAAPPGASRTAVVPVRGPRGVAGEAAEGPIDPVDLYLSTRAQEA